MFSPCSILSGLLTFVEKKNNLKFAKRVLFALPTRKLYRYPWLKIVNRSEITTGQGKGPTHSNVGFAMQAHYFTLVLACLQNCISCLLPVGSFAWILVLVATQAQALTQGT